MNKIIIRRGNYELFAIDYIEQTLDSDALQAMQQFLADPANADIAAELHTFESVALPLDETPVLPHKERLLQSSININNYEQWAIDYAEQTLPAHLQLEMDAFLAQQPRIKQLIQQLPTRQLQPDPSIVYPHKKQLFQTATNRPSIVVAWHQRAAAMAVAAMLLLCLGGGQQWWSNRNATNSLPTTAQTSPTPQQLNNDTYLNSTEPHSTEPDNAAAANNANQAAAIATDSPTATTIRRRPETKPRLNLPTLYANNATAKSVDNTVLATASRGNTSTALIATTPAAMPLVPPTTTLPSSGTATTRASLRNITETLPVLPSLSTTAVSQSRYMTYTIVKLGEGEGLATTTTTRTTIGQQMNNQTAKAEKLLDQTLLAALPNNLLPETISQRSTADRRKLVAVEIPLSTEAHRQLRNFIGSR